MVVFVAGDCGENEVCEEKIYSVFDWQARVVELGRVGGNFFREEASVDQRKTVV
jgi:hypothetical protein